MGKFANWKKIILFGVIGAIGCLIGGLLGELFLGWAQQHQTDATNAGGLIFNADLSARLKREHAQSGDVQISLMWNNRNDLDLHVIDPNGEAIFYKHRKARSGGELDVDMNADPRRGLSDQPVENVYWPAGAAPTGNYKVFVNYYSSHGAPDPTDFIVGVSVGGTASIAGAGPGAKEFTGSISFREKPRLIYEFTVEPYVAPQSAISWYTVIITGLWTGLLAVGLSFALVLGQNYYLRRPLLSLGQSTMVLGGGLVAGFVAGGIGEILFSSISQFESFAKAGQIVGWLILGAILGKGMGYFITNLSGSRAAIAGAIGGAVSGLVFMSVAQAAEAMTGRFIGAAILGFAIGLMVAIVEAAFREAWLDISYGPKETRAVSLGLEPVSIGGDPNACTVYARNAPAVAFRYKLDQGRITCEDVAKGQTSTVQPGSSQVAGNLTITVRAAGAKVQTAPSPQPSVKAPGGLVLRLSNGKTVALSDGVRLSNTDIPGLQANSAGGTVAEVGRNPNDPSILGLKNLSRSPWTATLANRDRIQVDPGRNVRLHVGATISFGSIQGEIQN
jgi:hypothetical protein